MLLQKNKEFLKREAGSFFLLQRQAKTSVLLNQQLNQRWLRAKRDIIELKDGNL